MGIDIDRYLFEYRRRYQ